MSDPVGERQLLARFESIGRELPGHVAIPPGDDLALLAGVRIDGVDGLLVGADQVVVGRHVRVDEDPFVIGRKAVLRNLSDVAAMAGRPLAIVATATLGPDRTAAWAAELHRGLHETGLAWKAPLVGGDLATHAHAEGPTVISVSILAGPALSTGRVITRDGGRPGDILAVTGTLGGSLAPDGGGRHLDFTPRLREATLLAEVLGDDLVAMMDLSDGLAQDAGRLAAAGGSIARIDSASIPASRGCDWRAAVGDGEDYELLFACRASPPRELAGTPVTVIGCLEVPAESLPAGAVVIGEGAASERIDHLGWEHRGGG